MNFFFLFQLQRLIDNSIEKSNAMQSHLNDEYLDNFGKLLSENDDTLLIDTLQRSLQYQIDCLLDIFFNMNRGIHISQQINYSKFTHILLLCNRTRHKTMIRSIQMIQSDSVIETFKFKLLSKLNYACKYYLVNSPECEELVRSILCVCETNEYFYRLNCHKVIMDPPDGCLLVLDLLNSLVFNREKQEGELIINEKLQIIQEQSSNNPLLFQCDMRSKFNNKDKIVSLILEVECDFFILPALAHLMFDMSLNCAQSLHFSKKILNYLQKPEFFVKGLLKIWALASLLKVAFLFSNYVSPQNSNPLLTDTSNHTKEYVTMVWSWFEVIRSLIFLTINAENKAFDDSKKVQRKSGTIFAIDYENESERTTEKWDSSLILYSLEMYCYSFYKSIDAFVKYYKRILQPDNGLYIFRPQKYLKLSSQDILLLLVILHTLWPNLTHRHSILILFNYLLVYLIKKNGCLQVEQMVMKVINLSSLDLYSKTLFTMFVNLIDSSNSERLTSLYSSSQAEKLDKFYFSWKSNVQITENFFYLCKKCIIFVFQKHSSARSLIISSCFDHFLNQNSANSCTPKIIQKQRIKNNFYSSILQILSKTNLADFSTLSELILQKIFDLSTKCENYDNYCKIILDSVVPVSEVNQDYLNSLIEIFEKHRANHTVSAASFSHYGMCLIVSQKHVPDNTTCQIRSFIERSMRFKLEIRISLYNSLLNMAGAILEKICHCDLNAYADDFVEKQMENFGWFLNFSINTVIRYIGTGAKSTGMMIEDTLATECTNIDLALNFFFEQMNNNVKMSESMIHLFSLLIAFMNSFECGEAKSVNSTVCLARCIFIDITNLFCSYYGWVLQSVLRVKLKKNIFLVDIDRKYMASTNRDNLYESYRNYGLNDACLNNVEFVSTFEKIMLVSPTYLLLAERLIWESHQESSKLYSTKQVEIEKAHCLLEIRSTLLAYAKCKISRSIGNQSYDSVMSIDTCLNFAKKFACHVNSLAFAEDEQIDTSFYPLPSFNLLCDILEIMSAWLFNLENSNCTVKPNNNHSNFWVPNLSFENVKSANCSIYDEKYFTNFLKLCFVIFQHVHYNGPNINQLPTNTTLCNTLMFLIDNMEGCPGLSVFVANIVKDVREHLVEIFTNLFAIMEKINVHPKTLLTKALRDCFVQHAEQENAIQPAFITKPLLAAYLCNILMFNLNSMNVSCIHKYLDLIDLLLDNQSVSNDDENTLEYDQTCVTVSESFLDILMENTISHLSLIKSFIEFSLTNHPDKTFTFQLATCLIEFSTHMEKKLCNNYTRYWPEIGNLVVNLNLFHHEKSRSQLVICCIKILTVSIQSYNQKVELWFSVGPYYTVLIKSLKSLLKDSKAIDPLVMNSRSIWNKFMIICQNLFIGVSKYLYHIKSIIAVKKYEIHLIKSLSNEKDSALNVGWLYRLLKFGIKLKLFLISKTTSVLSKKQVPTLIQILGQCSMSLIYASKFVSSNLNQCMNKLIAETLESTTRLKAFDEDVINFVPGKKKGQFLRSKNLFIDTVLQEDEYWQEDDDFADLENFIDPS